MLLKRVLALAYAVALALFLNVAAAAPAEKVLADLPKATWIAEGQGQRVVYVFIDANCPSCAQLYRNLRPLVEPLDLQIRWVPVAVVNATSLGKAAAMLQAPDPLAALRVNEEQYHGESYSGGLEEDIPTAETEQKLRANERLFNRLDIPVVPTMLFEDKNWRAAIIQGALSPVALRKVFIRLP
jgi:thiol:disulfide interchange protein DsbG